MPMGLFADGTNADAIGNTSVCPLYIVNYLLPKELRLHATRFSVFLPNMVPKCDLLFSDTARGPSAERRKEMAYALTQVSPK